MPYTKELNQVAEHVRSIGYYPIFVCLAGSQNYGLNLSTDQYQSDLDFKCIVLPRLMHLVKNSQPVSKTINYNGGFIDLKDVRAYADALFKCNPSYMETLYTPHYLAFNEGIELFATLRANRASLLDELAPFFIRALCGTFIKKKSSLYRSTPATEAQIEKYGYDPKSASHLRRLYVMLSDFCRTGEMCLVPGEADRKYILEVKQGVYSLPCIQTAVELWDGYMMDLKTKLLEEYESGKKPDYEVKRSCRKAINNTLYTFCLSSEGRRKE